MDGFAVCRKDLNRYEVMRSMIAAFVLVLTASSALAVIGGIVLLVAPLYSLLFALKAIGGILVLSGGYVLITVLIILIQCLIVKIRQNGGNH